MLRLVWVMGLASLILAPTPGPTGACGATDAVADAADTCLITGSWECRRMQVLGELTSDEEVQECVDELARLCATAMWPLECQPYPTNREVDFCVETLQRADTVDVPFDEIPECDFCP